MKKIYNNGFTLIELLGVLILLAVIALITFPIIDKVLSNAKNQAYERQKDSIIEAARMYVTTNGNYSTSQTQLSFQTLIDSGFLKEGEILDPRDSSKEMPGCLIYNWSESKNQYIFEYSEECKISYAVGDLLKVQVSDTETQNIYVLEVNGDEIVGLLDRNLPGGTVAWISEKDYYTATERDFHDDWSNYPEQLNENLYTYGPITALAAMNERTSSWTKVNLIEMPEVEELLKLTGFYQNLSETDKQNWESKYNDRNTEGFDAIGDCDSVAKCREKLTAAGYGDILLPEWAIINLMTTGDDSASAYWTSTPENIKIDSYPCAAWLISLDGNLASNYILYSEYIGVRPVLYVSQTNIISKLEAPEYVNPDDVGGTFTPAPPN